MRLVLTGTQLKVTDLCGREPPKVVGLEYLTDEMGLTDDDVDHILDTLSENPVAYVGEWQFEDFSA